MSSTVVSTPTLPTIHLGGLASGIDIQSIVDKLMAVEQTKITKVENKQVAVEADVSAWGVINQAMAALTTSLDTLRSYDTWSKVSAVASDSTKLSATASTSAAEASYSMTISKLAQAQTVASDSAASLTLHAGDTSTTDLVAAGVITAGSTFDIQGSTITIGATESLSTLAGKINTASLTMTSDKQVTASIIDNRLVIARSNTGSSTITMSGTPLKNIKVLKADGSINNELIAAQNAEFTLNGASIVRSSNTNLTDVVAGLSLNLTAKTTGAETVTLTVSRDRANVKSAINDFITSYNTALTTLTAYTRVDLTDPTNPRVGELQGDTTATALLSGLRRLAGQSKSPYMDSSNASFTYLGNTGEMNSLSTVGVWTKGTDGKLSVVDSDKLDYVLTNYFDKAKQLFRGVPSGGSGYLHGVAGDLYTFSNNASQTMIGTIAMKVQNLGKTVTDYDTQIVKMNAEMASYKQRLWLQFTAMDDAVSSMQSNSAAITSLTASLSNNK